MLVTHVEHEAAGPHGSRLPNSASGMSVTRWLRPVADVVEPDAPTGSRPASTTIPRSAKLARVEPLDRLNTGADAAAVSAAEADQAHDEFEAYAADVVARLWLVAFESDRPQASLLDESLRLVLPIGWTPSGDDPHEVRSAAIVGRGHWGPYIEVSTADQAFVHDLVGGVSFDLDEIRRWLERAASAFMANHGIRLEDGDISARLDRADAQAANLVRQRREQRAAAERRARDPQIWNATAQAWYRALDDAGFPSAAPVEVHHHRRRRRLLLAKETSSVEFINAVVVHLATGTRNGSGRSYETTYSYTRRLILTPGIGRPFVHESVGEGLWLTCSNGHLDEGLGLPRSADDVPCTPDELDKRLQDYIAQHNISLDAPASLS
jgi:hypothetical protein